MKLRETCLVMIALLAIPGIAFVSQKKPPFKLITLNPGHFHAALVQKSMYPEVDTTVAVYAPAGADVEEHLRKVNSYNTRSENSTSWKEDVYTGNDFLTRMLSEKKGNVVVIAGKNSVKTNYIQQSIKAGLHVLADKPMAIDRTNFKTLENSFKTAAEKNLLLYDIMTERYEITNTLQRELALLSQLFGILKKGSAAEPAIEMESVHHFYKQVSGNVLVRPSWFMDVSEQGEGITDVATHLVDLVQWECFPNQKINYTKDIKINAARRWPINMTKNQFTTITQLADFPEKLKKDVINDVLPVYANGEIQYQLKGTFVKVTARWEYKALSGGDTHYSILRGTKANLIIRQGAEQNYNPTLYIEPVNKNAVSDAQINAAINAVKLRFPGISLEKSINGWRVIIPEKYNDGHEAHFAKVTEKYLDYLKKGNLPEWEVPNMLAKYYTTTKALELAKNANGKK